MKLQDAVQGTPHHTAFVVLIPNKLKVVLREGSPGSFYGIVVTRNDQKALAHKTFSDLRMQLLVAYACDIEELDWQPGIGPNIRAGTPSPTTDYGICDECGRQDQTVTWDEMDHDDRVLCLSCSMNAQMERDIAEDRELATMAERLGVPGHLELACYIRNLEYKIEWMAKSLEKALTGRV